MGGLSPLVLLFRNLRTRRAPGTLAAAHDAHAAMTGALDGTRRSSSLLPSRPPLLLAAAHHRVGSEMLTRLLRALCRRHRLPVLQLSRRARADQRPEGRPPFRRHDTLAFIPCFPSARAGHSSAAMDATAAVMAGAACTSALHVAQQPADLPSKPVGSQWRGMSPMQLVVSRFRAVVSVVWCRAIRSHAGFIYHHRCSSGRLEKRRACSLRQKAFHTAGHSYNAAHARAPARPDQAIFTWTQACARLAPAPPHASSRTHSTVHASRAHSAKAARRGDMSRCAPASRWRGT